MKSLISKRRYKAMYRLLDRVSPIDTDCGRLCGAACCTCTYVPDDLDYTADGDENADNYMGIYLLPGEDRVQEDFPDDWIEWGSIQAEDYEYPPSWKGKIYFVQCKTPPICPRERRPIQCRTFPLEPYIDEKGGFHVIMCGAELPYKCPLIEEDIMLNDDFVKATYTVWKHLIEDPRIYDLVRFDSRMRRNYGDEITVCK